MNNTKELSVFDIIILIVVTIAMITFAFRIILDSDDKNRLLKKSLYIQNDNKYATISYYENINDCYNINKEEVSNGGGFTYTHNKESCEYIFKKANIIYNKFNLNQKIEGVATIEGDGFSQYYPLYKTKKNELVYFFGESFNESTYVDQYEINNYNTLIKEKFKNIIEKNVML